MRERNYFFGARVAARRLDPGERNHGNLAAGLFPIVVEKRHYSSLGIVEPFALLAGGNLGLGLKLLVADFERHGRVRHNVVIPGRMLGAPAKEAMSTYRSPSFEYTSGWT